MSNSMRPVKKQIITHESLKRLEASNKLTLPIKSTAEPIYLYL
jgi:hypothetical protein